MANIRHAAASLSAASIIVRPMSTPGTLPESPPRAANCSVLTPVPQPTSATRTPRVGSSAVVAARPCSPPRRRIDPRVGSSLCGRRRGGIRPRRTPRRTSVLPGSLRRERTRPRRPGQHRTAWYRGRPLRSPLVARGVRTRPLRPDKGRGARGMCRCGPPTRRRADSVRRDGRRTVRGAGSRRAFTGPTPRARPAVGGVGLERPLDQS